MNIPTIKNAVLTFIAIVSFIVILGDMSDGSKLTYAEFLLLKAVAIVAFAFCLQSWGVLNIRDIFREEA